MIAEFPDQPTSCRQFESRLPPYVDGLLSVSEAAQVEAHLEDCARCRESVAEQGAVRALLVSRRASLSEMAPRGLEGRVRAMSAEHRPAQALWPRFSPLAAAAALVLALTGGFYVLTGQSSVLLAAQLTLDHIKCFLIDGHEHETGIAADVGEARLRHEHGLNVTLPPPRADRGGELVTVRGCLYGEGWLAHGLYRVHGEPVSVFVVPDRSAAAADLRVFGRHAEVIVSRGVTYVVVSPVQLADVAAAVGIERQ